jgi:DNA mismatch repair ATPase MutL
VKEKSVSERKTELLSLPVKYTEEELQELGLDLARKHDELAALEAKKKAEADRMKSEISAAQAQAQVLARRRMDGYYYRDVECSVEFDFKRGTKTYVRLDTGEIARSVTMTDRERQTELGVQRD